MSKRRWWGAHRVGLSFLWLCLIALSLDVSPVHRVLNAHHRPPVPSASRSHAPHFGGGRGAGHRLSRYSMSQWDEAKSTTAAATKLLCTPEEATLITACDAPPPVSGWRAGRMYELPRHRGADYLPSGQLRMASRLKACRTEWLHCDAGTSSLWRPGGSGHRERLAFGRRGSVRVDPVWR